MRRRNGEHMSILDSLKDHLRGDNRKEDEEEFARAFREGRYPEGVDDFEPLSNTGNYFSAEEVRRAQQLQDLGDPSTSGPLAPGESAPFAPIVEDTDLEESASFPPVAAGLDRTGQLAAPDPYDYDDDRAVRVVERGDHQGSRPAPKPRAKSFADRLQDRVAEAQAKAEDEARQRAADSSYDYDQEPPEPSRPNGPDVIGAAPRLRTANVDVRDDELERELARRRQANEAARNERRERNQQRLRASDDEVAAARARVEARAAGARVQAAAGPSSQAARSAVPPLEMPALPTKPVVLRVRSYEDVSHIAEALVNKHQPAVLFMRGTTPDVSARVLDFAFGLCCGCNAKLIQLEDKVFCAMPSGTTIGDRERASLVRQGILRG